MTKQELIEQINELRTCKGWNDKFADITDMVSKEDVLKLVEQLSEPKKAIIPKMVVEWLQGNDWREETKGEQSLFDILDNLNHDFENGYHKEVRMWIYDNGDTLARAWLDGYEVEKEKLYTVELPNPHSIHEATVLGRNKNGFIVIEKIRKGAVRWKEYHEYHLNEAEIKQDFGWAWDAGFAKEV